MTKKEENGNSFLKKITQKFFPYPQTRRQVSAYGSAPFLSTAYKNTVIRGFVPGVRHRVV